MWVCSSCSYPNTTSIDTCEMCKKRRDLKDYMSKVKECSLCSAVVEDGSSDLCLKCLRVMFEEESSSVRHEDDQKPYTPVPGLNLTPVKKQKMNRDALGSMSHNMNCQYKEEAACSTSFLLSDTLNVSAAISRSQSEPCLRVTLRAELKKREEELRDSQELVAALSDRLVQYPMDWSPLQPGSDDLVLIEVPRDSSEYVKVINNGRISRNTLPRPIHMIRRIQNWKQYQIYTMKTAWKAQSKRETAEQGKMFLWHGAGSEAIDNIMMNGLKLSYAGQTGQSLGHGLYFGADITTSLRYSPASAQGLVRVLLCEVYVGRYSQGSENLREPPVVYGVKMDSVVDSKKPPEEHCVFEEDLAYPLYEFIFSTLENY